MTFKCLALSYRWKVKLARSCPTLLPLNYTLHEILQARIGGCPFPSPGDFANPGIEPRSPALQADSLPAEPQGKPRIYISKTGQHF